MMPPPFLFPVSLMVSVLLAGGTPDDDTAAPGAGPSVVATIDVGAAPHGIRFSPDGRWVYVAVSGDDEIAVIDTATLTVVARAAAGETPLDLIALGDGALVATQFRGATLLEIGSRASVLEPGVGGATSGPVDALADEVVRRWDVGAGPSLFASRLVDGLALLSCEFADRLVVFDVDAGVVRTSYPTGDAPYPPAVTRDGVLAFVPNRTDGTVTIVDLLNGEVATTVDVGARPEGGALLEDDTHYVVACSGDDELAWINTASYEVVARTSGVGPSPFAVTATPDGRLLLVNDAGADTISIVDVATRAIVGSLTVGAQPIVVRVHPDGLHAYVSNEVDGTVSIIALPRAEPRRVPAVVPRRNEVVVVGTIHGEHRTSERYDLDLLRELVRAVAPDVVLAEIPPNRAEAAMRGYRDDGAVTEPRVARFPEYVDVIYPLLDELGFAIVPTAAWTEPMARFRREALERIAADPGRADEWAAYEEASAASEMCIAEHGAPDDPWFIHTDQYDECYGIGVSFYDVLFNEELGPGGWTNVNAAHYANIAAALDERRGEGSRVLVTYGAGHKGWLLHELRRRDDIEVLDVRPFLDRAAAALER